MTSVIKINVPITYLTEGGIMTSVTKINVPITFFSCTASVGTVSRTFLRDKKYQ